MNEKRMLKVNLDNGDEAIINVRDIIKDTETDKEYVIYNFLYDSDIYASILVEGANSFLLKTIVDEDERNLISDYIKFDEEYSNE